MVLHILTYLYKLQIFISLLLNSIYPPPDVCCASITLSENWEFTIQFSMHSLLFCYFWKCFYISYTLVCYSFQIFNDSSLLEEIVDVESNFKVVSNHREPSLLLCSSLTSVNIYENKEAGEFNEDKICDPQTSKF